MTTHGDLGSFPLEVFLQVLADLGKSGKLTVSRSEERGVVILREGRIIYAASSSIREALGGLLVGQKLITERQLLDALTIQEHAEEELLLGNVLVDQGVLQPRDLERVVVEQTQRVMLELLGWRQGSFEFGPLDFEDREEIAPDVSELLLSDGLSADSVCQDRPAESIDVEADEQLADWKSELEAEAPSADLAVAPSEVDSLPGGEAEVENLIPFEVPSGETWVTRQRDGGAVAEEALAPAAVEESETQAGVESESPVSVDSGPPIIAEESAELAAGLTLQEELALLSATTDESRLDSPGESEHDEAAQLPDAPDPSPVERVPPDAPGLSSAVERELASLAALSALPDTAAVPRERTRDEPRLSRSASASPSEVPWISPEGSRSLTSLRDLMIEIRSPEFTGELSSKIMEYASELFGRSVLFSLEGSYFCGMGSFAIGLDPGAAEAIRQMRIPADEASILADVTALRGAYQGPLPGTEWNRRLVEQLGGGEPEEAVAVPLVVDSDVIMVLYGDTALGAERIESTTALELLVLQVGLAMERKLLLDDSEDEGVESAVERPGLRTEDLRSLVDADPQATLVVDVQGKILYANRSMGASVKSTVVELLGSNVGALVHPEDRAGLMEVLQEIEQGGAPGAKSVRLPRADGSWRGFYLLASTAGDKPGGRCVMLRTMATGTQLRHDSLTGLLHRDALVALVDKRIERSKQEDNSVFAVLLLDIDRFKLVNAGFGWAAGNELLRAVGSRLVEHLRPSDSVARMGGDQFCVIFDRLRARRDATLVGSRIIEMLSHPFDIGGEEICASLSMGVALNHPDTDDAEEMIAEAETLLMATKAEHGSSLRVRKARPGGRSRAVARLKLERDLRRGLELDEFKPYFQPIISLETGEIAVLELLVRWEHPKKGLLQPATFLPAAEETGLIVPIAKKLLRQGCLQLGRWQERFAADPPLALGMNFTTTHLEQSEVMNTLQESMSRTGVEGRQLVVEITESMLMQQMDRVLQILGVLKELDVRIFVDDFGVEYSSLSYLHRLPIDAVKVDRTFVGRIGSDRGSDVIVEAIVNLAHDLGRMVVAEGVENPEQLRIMRDLGCELGQGFLFARPESAERTAEMLASKLPWQSLIPSLSDTVTLPRKRP